MYEFIERIWCDDQGQDIAEYAVMLAVILVLVVGTIRLVGTAAHVAGRVVDSAGNPVADATVFNRGDAPYDHGVPAGALLFRTTLEKST